MARYRFKRSSWDKYQGRKNIHGNPWTKNHKSTLNDFDFKQLPPELRYQFMALPLIANDHTGVLPERIEEIEDNLNITGFSFEPFLRWLEPVDIDSDDYKAELEGKLTDIRDGFTPHKPVESSENGKPKPPKKDYHLPEFTTFYEAYPNKKDKQKATTAWKNIQSLNESLIKDIMQGLEAQKNTHEWAKDAGQYIPLPTTWIHGRRWEDEVIPGGGNVVQKHILKGPCPDCGEYAEVESEENMIDHACQREGCTKVFMIAH